MELDEESKNATELLKWKSVAAIFRNNETEVVIQFTDGARLFINSSIALELSITGA